MKKTLLFFLFFSYGFSQNPDLNLNNYKFIVVDEIVGNINYGGKYISDFIEKNLENPRRGRKKYNVIGLDDGFADILVDNPNLGIYIRGRVEGYKVTFEFYDFRRNLLKVTSSSFTNFHKSVLSALDYVINFDESIPPSEQKKDIVIPIAQTVEAEINNSKIKDKLLFFNEDVDKAYFDRIFSENQGEKLWKTISKNRDEPWNTKTNNKGFADKVHIIRQGNESKTHTRDIMFLMDTDNNYLANYERYSISPEASKYLDYDAIEGVFESYIGLYFNKFGSPDKKYNNTTIDAIGMDVYFESAFVWNLLLDKQPFKLIIGYEIEDSKVKNSRGDYSGRSIKNKVGSIYKIPTEDKLSNFDYNLNNAGFVAEGFYNAYLESRIEDYVEPSWIKDEFKGTKGLQIIFGLENANSPTEYLQNFELLLWNYYKIPDFSNPQIGLDVLSILQNVDFTFSTLDSGVIAIATGMDNNCESNIVIDIEQWNKTNYSERLFIIFHELGHEIFNLKHSDGLRLMATSKYDLSSKEELGEIIHEMLYHVKRFVPPESYICK